MKKHCAPMFGAGLLAVLLAVTACTAPRQMTPTRPEAPPAGGAGGGLIGVNPDIPGTPNATTTTLSYGPYTVPAAQGTGHGQEGMIRDAIAFGVRKPCTNCLVTSMQATLRYADGRVANTDTGQWLHHIVLASNARSDAVCGLALTGLLGERFFASGNERTRARFPAGFGYPIGATDNWNLVYDLMNATTAPTSVQVEMTYEWVPNTTPGMRPLRPVWLDVGTCDRASVNAGTGAYQYSRTWVVNRPGRVVGIGGHLHDGGTHITIRNDSTGELLCTSVAGYGGPGYEGQPGHPSQNLSSMSQCLAVDADHPVGTIANGQQVSITAHYDADRHPQHGDHPVMGIAITYVAS